MESSISKEIYDAGRELAAASPSNIADKLNRLLNRFLGWPFRASKGFAVSSDGIRTDSFGTLIYAKGSSSSVSEPVEISADILACVIDVLDNLNLESLCSSYERIVLAKKIKKTSLPKAEGVPITSVTLGIIFAIDTALPV